MISGRRFVTASRAARLAIHESVIAQTNVDDRLAKNAILLAHAVRFGLLALRAFVLRGAGTSAHGTMVSLDPPRENVTPVMNRGQGSGARQELAIVYSSVPRFGLREEQVED